MVIDVAERLARREKGKAKKEAVEVKEGKESLDSTRDREEKPFDSFDKTQGRPKRSRMSDAAQGRKARPLSVAGLSGKA